LKIRQARAGPDPSKSITPKLLHALSPGLLIFLIVIAIREIGATGTSTFMTTYFVDFRNLSEATASLVFALGPIIGILGSLGGGYFGEKLGPRKTLNYIILCCTISLLALSFASHLYSIAIVYLIYTVFSNALWSPMNTIVASVTPESERGLSYSYYFFTEGLMDSIAPSIAAGVIELSSVWHIFPFSAAFFIISLLVLRLLPRFERKQAMPRLT
jgi:MFS family permease